MNRRKQTNPKRNTCSSENIRATSRQKERVFRSTSNASDEAVPMDEEDTEAAREREEDREEDRRHLGGGGEGGDETRESRRTDVENVEFRMGGPRSPESAAHRNVHRSGADGDCAGNGGGQEGPDEEDEEEADEEARSSSFTPRPLLRGDLSPTAAAPSPAAASASGESEKRLDFSGFREDSTSVKSTIGVPNVDASRDVSRDAGGGAGPGHSFVEQLESFVASLNAQTTKRSAAADCFFGKFPAREFDKTATTGERILAQNDRRSTGVYDLPCRLPTTSSSSSLSGASYFSDHPLDLSTGGSDGKRALVCREKAPTRDTARPDSAGPGCPGGRSSLLASLEQKFGEHSQILDRVGSRQKASHFGGGEGGGGVGGGGSCFPLGRESLPEAGEQATGCRRRFPHLAAAGNALSSAHRSNRVDGNRLRRKESAGKDGGEDKKSPAVAAAADRTTTTKETPSRPAPVADPTEGVDQKRSSTTSLRCSCQMEFDRLYLLTVHLQETGHRPPSSSTPVTTHGGGGGGQSNRLLLDGNAKLVRGQDVWLNSGSEQTRLILRCMQCHRSFRSLPELTIHMIQTGHYQNLVRPELGQRRVWNEAASSPSSSSSSSSGSDGADRLSCRFCREVFDDADSLGLHVVASGHYPADEGKLRVESSSPSVALPLRCSGVDEDSVNRVDVTPMGVANDFCRPTRGKNARKERHDRRHSETNPKSSNADKDIKTSRVEPGSSCSPPPPPPPQFLRPEPASSAQEESNCVAVRSEAGRPPEEKQSALTAMQRFINRSFDHFRATKPGTGGGEGGGGVGEERRIAKHSPSSSSASSSSRHNTSRSTPPRKRSRYADRRTKEEDEEEDGEEDGGPGGRRQRRPMTDEDGGGAEEEESWKFQQAWAEEQRRRSVGPHRPLVVIASGGQIVTGPVAPSADAFSSTDWSSSRKPAHENDKTAHNNNNNLLRRNGEPASTLDSLQELVFSRACFKGRSPTVPSYVQSTDRKPSQPQALFVSSKTPVNPSIPETLILVNPIVTVMPGSAAAAAGLGYTAGSSLSIMLSPHHHSPYAAELAKESRAGSSPAAAPPPDSVDSDAETATSAGEFRCLTCRRSFASKGSYRYHRSRYHAYPELERTRTKNAASSNPGICPRLNSDARNKFSKYYQLANELSGKTN